MWDLKNKKFVVSYSFMPVNDCSNGTAKNIVSQQQQFNEYTLSYVYIYGMTKQFKGLPLITRYSVVIDGQYYGEYTIYEVMKNLKQVSENNHEIVAFMIHHLLYGRLEDISALLDFLDPVPIYFFAHDFATVCANYMLTHNGRYSCITDGMLYDKCSTCSFNSQKERMLPAIKYIFEKFHNRFKAIICPSEYVKKIWVQAYPALKEKVIVVPHLVFSDKVQTKPYSTNLPVKVAFLGRKTDFKGWNQWQDLVKEVGQDSELEFYVLGTEMVEEENMIYKKVSVADTHLNAMSSALIENQIDITILWSLCGETYSYTCMESIEAGCFIVTSSLSGNIADVVKTKKCGLVLQTTNELINLFHRENRDKLLDLLKEHSTSWNATIKKSYTNDEVVREINPEISFQINQNITYRKFWRIYDSIMLALWKLGAKIKK